jgi:hypothetical protein
MKKTPVGAGIFCTLTHSGILHFSLPEISYSLWSKTFSVLVTRNSVKASIQKITGKTAGDSSHGEGRSRTWPLSENSVKMYCGC